MPLFYFTGHTDAHPYSLTIDGLDVVKEPAVPSRYGVSVDSINVTEAGPGGVSSMSFVIDDPSLLITIADNANIVYWDLTNNLPIFVGFLERVAIVPDFGQQGRSIEVGAYGREALLDEIIIPALTARAAFADKASANLGFAMYDGAMLAVLGGFTPLRTGADANVADAPDIVGGRMPSSLTGPIGATDGFRTTALAFSGADLVLDGQSVRQAFETYYGNALTYTGGGATTAAPTRIFLSVDLWGGIRLFAFGGSVTTWMPSDYAALTITDTPTGGIAAENLRWEQDMSNGAVTNAVYVKGPNAASTGWVVGDTTSGRHEAFASTSGTDGASKQASGNNLLTRGVAGRGSFDLTSYTPTNVHPGSLLTITDARVGFSAKTMLITEIRKTFGQNGKQNWSISFIDVVDASTAGWASAMRLTRSYTRATQN